MKNVPLVLFAYLVYNVSFAQPTDSKFTIENKPIEETETSVFKCYPNPVENDLFVIGTHKLKSIEFINAYGKSIAIYQYDNSIIRLNVSDLKPGMYLLKVIDKNDRQDIQQLIVK